MLSMRRAHWPKLPARTAAIIIVTAVVLAAVLVAAYARQSSNAYAQKTAQYADTTRRTLRQAGEDITRAGDDASRMRTALTTAKTALETTAAPKPAALLGVTFADKADTAKTQAIRQASDALRKELAAQIAGLDYQQRAADTLNRLKTIQATDVAGLQNAAQQWSQGQAALAAITPPPAMAGAHDKLVSSLQTIAQEAGKLPALFEQQDAAGFAAQAQAIAAAVAGLRALSQDFEAASAQQDAALEQAAGKLAESLNKTAP